MTSEEYRELGREAIKGIQAGLNHDGPPEPWWSHLSQRQFRLVLAKMKEEYEKSLAQGEPTSLIQYLYAAEYQRIMGINRDDDCQ